MATGALRRRIHHGDVDGRRNEHMESSSLDGLSEPLLGTIHDSSDSRSEDLWNEEKRKERLHWTFVFTNLIAQWAQWLASIVFGSGSLFGRLLPLNSTNVNGQKRLAPSLCPLQEERLKFLKQRLEVPFDGSRVEHQDALKQLWRLAYPDRELPPLKSERWKEMGWQGSDPSTDFRGGGFISLENLIYFAKKYPEAFQRLLHKTEGERAEWEYPFAVAGINISFMLAQLLDLQSAIPKTSVGIRFIELLGDDDMAFDNLYCVAFQLMDAQWLAKRASYMEFNDVLKSTSKQIERELDLEDVSSFRDLPAYNLLGRLAFKLRQQLMKKEQEMSPLEFVTLIAQNTHIEDEMQKGALKASLSMFFASETLALGVVDTAPPSLLPDSLFLIIRFCLLLTVFSTSSLLNLPKIRRLTT